MTDRMATLRSGFRTTRACGPDGIYELKIKFQSLEELDAADEELRTALDRENAKDGAAGQEQAGAVADGSTPGPWRVEKRERDGEMVMCWVAAPDCNGFAYAAEILGDDEYRDGDEAKAEGMPRRLADCELVVKAVAFYRAHLAAPGAAIAAREQEAEWRNTLLRLVLEHDCASTGPNKYAAWQLLVGHVSSADLEESPWICDCGIERLFPAPCGECDADARTAASAMNTPAALNDQYPEDTQIIAAFEGIERSLESIPEGIEGYLDDLSEAVNAARAIVQALIQRRNRRPRETNNPLTAWAIEILVAAGHVSREKADEAYRMACETFARERDALASRIEAPAPHLTAAPQTEMEKAILMALACIRWQAFGECRTPEWNGAPPTPADTVAKLEAALIATQPVDVICTGWPQCGCPHMYECIRLRKP